MALASGATLPNGGARLDNEESLTIVAADGFPLAAVLTRPPARARAILVINSAMGVPHRIYAPFARFMAQQGIVSLRYDYRGISGSAPASLRGFEGSLLDWAQLDYPSAVAAARREYPDVPLVLLGHSVGGQIFGLDRASLEATALIGVAAQSGYWRHWDGAGRVGLWSLWHIFIPSLTPTLGFFPASLFGMGENLPRNVALQWAACGRHPEYVRNPDWGAKEQHYESIGAPLLSIGMADDFFAPPRSVDAFRRWFPRSAVTSVTVPTTERLGHFGWFRESQGAPHWRAMLDWLK